MTRENYRTQMRAVFLAAIMVISMVGMSVAFTGAAAASSSLDDEAYNPDVPYQGQDVVYKNTSGDAVDEDESYELREVDDFDSGEVDSSSFVEELDDVDEAESTITVETDDLDAGDYFIRGGELPTRPDEDDTFEIRIQDLDAEFDDDEVTDEGRDSDTELDIESNRGTYSLVVDAGDGDLDNEELAQIHVTLENVDDDELGADGEFDADEIGVGDITLSDYVLILEEVQSEVVFEDEDVTEPLDIEGEDEVFDSDVTIDSDDVSDAAGGSITIGDDVTFEEIATPSSDDDLDVNPFNALLINEDQDEEDDPDDRVVMLEISDTDQDIDFTGIDDGDYEFNFNVADTEASASAEITVNEEDQDADFSEGTYQAGAGDIAHLEFELEDTDEAWLQIGDGDSDFVDFLYVELDESDEPFELTVNTRLLGTPGENVDDEAVYDVENDEEFYSLLHTDADEDFSSSDNSFMQSTDVPLFADDDDDHDDPSEYYNDLDLIDEDVDNAEEIREEMLTRPLQAIDYELQLASDNVDDDEGVFDSDAGAGEASDQLDSAVLELQDANIGDINTWTAFEEDADDEDDVEELLEIVTERDEIAYEDRLVVQVEANGLYGGLVAAGDDSTTYEGDDVDFDRLDEGLSTDVAYDFFDAEEINFDIESDTATGQDPLEVDLDNDDDDDTYMLIGPDQDQFFLIVDTGSDDAFSNGDAPEDGASFTAELEFDADNDDDRFEFWDDQPFVGVPSESQNYPYLSDGDVLSSSAEFDIEPREVSFDNLNADDEVQAENIEDSVISGETNVAPGSDAEIRVSSTAASTSFREGQDVDINDEGEFTAEFDFDGQEPGDEFDTRFRTEGSNVDTVDSVIVDEGDLGLEDPTEDDEDDVVDDEDDVVDDDDDVVDDDDDVVDDEEEDVEDVDDETPGFGALVALVALIGAALLAARRQN